MFADLASPSAYGRSAALIGRAAVEGVTALPLMAMDAGVGIRNLITGSNYDAPSKLFNDSLNQLGVPQPHGLVERAGSFLVSAATGSRVPAPEAANQAPKNFVPPSDTPVRDAALAAAQNEGYVVPPATTNPSGINRALETVGGKVATAQDASIKNQSITNRLAKRALGLGDDEPLTREVISQIRGSAGKIYEKIRNIGPVQADQEFTQDLAGIVQGSRNTARSFPGLGSSEIDNVVESLNQPQFEAGDAVDAMRILRNSADKAFRSGDKALGKSYRSASDALEGVLERTLEKSGDKSSINAFKAARQLIAKTYTVDKALNESTGNVIAAKLAGDLAKGKPLTGELKLAAEFARAFPKAAQQILDSGSVRNTDLIVAGGTAALSQNYKYLLYPFLRQAVRVGLLSKPGQKLAVEGALRTPPGVVMGAIPGAHDLVAD